jgi:diaminohydroxyphosphoribosylaminopyrimidine deaminase / 5-amino-6-(5-phosphoribosylamino)uracil reductase
VHGEVGADLGAPGERRPLRVVVDSTGRTPALARVRDDTAPTWIATATDVGTTADGQVDLDALLKRLFARGVRAALLEGGPTLAGAFLTAGLIDEVVGYVAPKLLGAGASALGSANVRTIADAIELTVTDVTQIGPDIRITAIPVSAGSSEPALSRSSTASSSTASSSTASSSTAPPARVEGDR